MQESERLRRELDQIRIAVGAETERHIMALAQLRVREARAELALSALQRASQVGTMGTMESTTRGGAISAAKVRIGTLWQSHLRARGLSIPEWVTSRGRKAPGVESARSWVKQPGRGGRPIPRVWADALAAEFEDPSLAMTASWPSGIRE